MHARGKESSDMVGRRIVRFDKKLEMFGKIETVLTESID